MSRVEVTPSDVQAARALDVPHVEDQLDEGAIRTRVSQQHRDVYSRMRHAILNAVPHEYAAIMAVFGQPNVVPNKDHPDTSLSYIDLPQRSGGVIPILIAEVSGAGIAQAAAATAQIIFKNRFIDKIIMVGIAAGQPALTDGERDVRLGDIVVGRRIVPYDHVKLTNGKVEIRGESPSGDSALLGIVQRLTALQEMADPHVERPWMKYIEQGMRGLSNAKRPGLEHDHLASQRNYVSGKEYERKADEPHVLVGTIGSASTLLKDAAYRDALNASHGTIAYEMEGAGLAITAASYNAGHLMVRGICDYADDHKDDTWQRYASVCAAAFARAVLEAT